MACDATIPFGRRGSAVQLLAIMVWVLWLAGAQAADTNEVGDYSTLLTPEEQTWLAHHGPLRYAPDPDFPPFEWFNDSGVAKGISVDVLALVAQRLHLTIQLVHCKSWSEVLEGAKAGKVDVLTTIATSRERTNYLTFTPSYFSMTAVVFVQENSPVNTLDDLNRKRVGVVKNYILYERLMLRQNNFTVVPVATTREGMAMLRLGKLDAMFESFGVGSYVITHEAIDGLRMLSETPDHDPQPYCMASPDPMLARILAKGLTTISEQELQAIQTHWTPLTRQVKEFTLPVWIKQASFILVIAVVLAGVWLTTLRAKLASKERELREEFQKKAELEARFSDLALNAPDLVMTWSADGRITSGNAAAGQILGYAPAELNRMNILSLCEPASVPQLRPTLLLQDANIKEGTQEVRLISKNRQACWFEVKLRRISPGGAIQAIGRDLTERRQMQEELNRERLFLAGLVQAVPAAIWMVDPVGKILWANELTEQLLGRSHAELIGRFGHEVVPVEQAGRIRKLSEEAMAKRIPMRADENFSLGDGQKKLLELILTPMFETGGHSVGVLGIGFDVTEQRHTQEQLQQRQKLDSIGQLAGGIAHDFNNILAAIILQLDYLISDSNLDAEIGHQLGEVLASAKRAATLTRQLLIFSRQEVAQLKPVDVDSMLADILKMLRRLIGANIGIEFEGLPKPAWVVADTSMLEQVVVNLVVNARDAMPHGGRITLSTAIVDLDAAAAVAAPEARAGQFVSLSVRDTGSGMDAATLHRIFEPFFTTKEVGKGTGLGLATVHGIVKKHEGWIQVVSEVGKGSTFTVFLPATKPDCELASASQKPTQFPGRGETILLVEDDAELRQKIETLLRHAGYKLFTASHGREALVEWAAHSGTIQLLLTDMIMPQELSGVDLARCLLVEKPALQVIIMSGYSLELSQNDLFSHGQMHFLQKPFQGQTLLEMISARLLAARAA
jgi:PAS domain S-box-containing protein